MYKSTNISLVTVENATIEYTGDYLEQRPTLINLSAIVSEEDDGEAGDLANANVDFEVYLVNNDGTTTQVGTYTVQCNEQGEVTTTQALDVGVYSIVAKIKNDEYYKEAQSIAICPVYDPAGGKANGGNLIISLSFFTPQSIYFVIKIYLLHI